MPTISALFFEKSLVIFIVSFNKLSAKDGQEFKIGDLTIIALHTPGHSLESTTYLLKDLLGEIGGGKIDAMAGDIYGQGKVLALSKYKFLKWSYMSFLWGMSGAIAVFIIQNIL